VLGKRERGEESSVAHPDAGPTATSSVD
jgi:hypothetical protein